MDRIRLLVDITNEDQLLHTNLIYFGPAPGFPLELLAVKGTKLVGSLMVLAGGGGPKLKLLVCTGPSLLTWGAFVWVRDATELEPLLLLSFDGILPGLV